MVEYLKVENTNLGGCLSKNINTSEIGSNQQGTTQDENCTETKVEMKDSGNLNCRESKELVCTKFVFLISPKTYAKLPYCLAVHL